MWLADSKVSYWNYSLLLVNQVLFNGNYGQWSWLLFCTFKICRQIVSIKVEYKPAPLDAKFCLPRISSFAIYSGFKMPHTSI